MTDNFLSCLFVAAFSFIVFAAAKSGSAVAQNNNQPHCVEQVSIKVENTSNTVINSGAASLRTPHMQMPNASCLSQTAADFNANTSWSDPTKVCARYQGFGIANGHFFVMATAYALESGNNLGVNRVAGYDMHCNGGRAENVNTLPSTVVVVPHIY